MKQELERIKTRAFIVCLRLKNPGCTVYQRDYNWRKVCRVFYLLKKLPNE